MSPSMPQCPAFGKRSATRGAGQQSGVKFDMSYTHHVFFCTNQRDDGRNCCGEHQAAELRDYAKNRIKQLGLNRADGVRINSAGCMGRCDDGPAIVVYPQGTWYRYASQQDIDLIIDQHLLQGEIVSQLVI